jgi:repressor LexA
MSLASNIRYLRKKQGWSQDYLAEQLGYKSYTTIQKWESGVSEPPLKKAHAIAALFRVDIDDLTQKDLEQMEISPPSEHPTNLKPPSDSELKFALFGDASIDDALLEEVKRFAQFAKEQKGKK